MNSFNNIELLFLRSKIKKPFELKVSGISMRPILTDGDAVTVCRKDSYEIGDILVFLYKNSELLVHRLLKIENGRYFCKGDNSFRLEDVDTEHIAGAVILDNDQNNTPDFIEHSLLISRIFRKSGYSIEKTKDSPEYKTYKEKYLE